MCIGGEMIAKSTADVDDCDAAAVSEIGDTRSCDIPLIPARQFTQAVLSSIKKHVLLTRVRAELKGGRGGKVFGNQIDAIRQGIFAAHQKCRVILPHRFSMKLP